MKLSALVHGLPLLTKDLIEQAAQRRTYVLRVVYAVVLYGAALWVYADIAGNGAQAGIANLGRGRAMFAMLVGVQFLAIIILLPGITCGAITVEKERDTLGLLLLTQLSPATIILEKLLSRLVTMGTYQLLSLPLFAVVYGLGGVELSQIFAAIWLMGCLSLLVGTWSLYCSVWHRTTTGAFINAYLMMPVACIFLIPLRAMIVAAPSAILVLTVPIVLISIAWVAKSTRELLPRAFVQPRNRLLEFFQKLDAFFEELNNQTTRGIVLFRERDVGPMFEPIAWRETRKKSLGTVRYLFRLLAVLEIPLALAIAWTVSDTQRNSFNGPTAFFLSMLWPIAALAITVHTTNVLASERSRQTLDVLLVTPLTTAELVSQKLAGVRRLMFVLSVPLATLLVFQTVWTLYVLQGLGRQRHWVEDSIFLCEILGMTLAIVVYQRVIQWIAFHLTMRLKNQTQAVLLSLAAIVGVCALPFLFVTLLANHWGASSLDPHVEWIQWLSPVRVLFHRQFAEAYLQNPSAGYVGSWASLFWLSLHAVLFVALWLMLRYTALRSFSKWVGRTEPLGGTR